MQRRNTKHVVTTDVMVQRRPQTCVSAVATTPRISPTRPNKNTIQRVKSINFISLTLVHPTRPLQDRLCHDNFGASPQLLLFPHAGHPGEARRKGKVGTHNHGFDIVKASKGGANTEQNGLIKGQHVKEAEYALLGGGLRTISNAHEVAVEQRPHQPHGARTRDAKHGENNGLVLPPRSTPPRWRPSRPCPPSPRRPHRCL